MTARILALDTLTVVLSALLVVDAAAERSSYYMDAALILALLAFGGESTEVSNTVDESR